MIVRDSKGKQVPQKGDRVTWTWGGRRYFGVVKSRWHNGHSERNDDDFVLHIECDFRKVNGRVSRYVKFAHQVSIIPDVPIDQANVYADWLEENGYNDAAMALRQAFPLSEVR